MKVPQKKLKTEIPYTLTILGIYSKNIENRVSKRYLYTYVNCSSIYNSQDMEATKMSIIRWMDEKVVHVHNAILDTEKNETMPSAAP